MSYVTKLPPVDAVVIGLGWAGSIIAKEMVDAGLQVVGIERGPWIETGVDFNINTAPDELRYARRRELMVQTVQNTVTARNTTAQEALPMRQWGSFHPGNGTGGAGLHWAGIAWRFQPNEFRLASHLRERYGAELDSALTLQDWGTDWSEMEPAYDAWERIAGISGQAGNIQGKLQDGGNRFEGARQRDYPTKPIAPTYSGAYFAQAAANLGYQPFHTPSALLSEAYTNSYGITMGPCTYCGFCTNYGCANLSKASAITTVLPALARQPGFTARTLCEVVRIELDTTGTRATGVTFVDASGQEMFQPADIVVSAAFTFENVRLMLLSGVGQPYDPATGQGVTGRNYCYQTANNVQLFFDDRQFNNFIGGGAISMAIDETNNDNFDHAGLGFVGGGSTRCGPIGAPPIASRPVPKGTPTWGSDWKKETVRSYNTTLSIGCESSSYAVRGNYLSLDPTYKDRLGRPLLRITFDFPENDLRMSQYVTDKIYEIGQAMNPRKIERNPMTGHWNTVPYQSSHVVGGFVMGADPTTSGTNKYLQSWQVPNLFVVGANAFPQNPGYNPTATVGALAIKAAWAITRDYIRNPGALIDA